MNVLDFVFPKRCIGCGRIGRYFCGQCRQEMRPIPSHESICPVCEGAAIDGATHPKCRTRYGLDGLTSFFHYDGIIRKAVKTLKYRLISDLATEFISLVPLSPSAWILRHARNDNMVLVPIPLHQARLMERGFNQAEVLGTVFAERLHIPIKTDILRRTRKTTPQVEMKKRKERLENMKNVFNIASDAHTHDRFDAAILFDDVFTTGATMRSAANVLKRNGFKQVWAVTTAR